MKKIILFLVLSLTIFSATTKVTTPKIQEIKLNEIITVPEFCEFTIKDIVFSKKLYSSNPAEYYHYYESKDPEGIYFNAKILLKSLLSESKEVSDFIDIEIIYNNKYKYKAYPLAEESDGSDFNSFAYIDPLRKLLTHSFVEVPLEVSTETQKPLYLIIKVNDKEYKYIVR